MDKIELKIIGISYSQTQTGAYALVLKEVGGERRIPIIIGASEAQAIAIELEKLKPIRPLTHDLFVSLATSFAISVIEIYIIKLQEGIFYSELVCERGGAIVKMDSRTSDAIALALRFRCPIYATEEIVSKAGIVLGTKEEAQHDNKTAEQSSINTLSKKTKDELQKMMDKAVNNENYELASEIRDEIAKRKK